MINYDTIKLGLIISAIVFVYMVLASINNYLPASLAIGLLVSYFYKGHFEKEKKRKVPVPLSPAISFSNSNANNIEENNSKTTLGTCPFLEN